MKTAFKLSALSAVLFLLASCGSIQGIDFAKAAETGTPENSVIFYGNMSNCSTFAFSQRNKEYSPDYQRISNCENVFISAPVAPGSTYTIQYFYGQISSGYTTWYWNETYPINWHGFDFKIPNKPGLYYVGDFDGQQSFRNGEFVKDKHLLKSDKAMEISCLEAVLDVYKKTAWESVIRERIKELRK